MNTTSHEASDELVQARARIKDLEYALGQNDSTLALAYGLTPRLSDLMGLLLSLPVVTSEMIRQRLEIATDAKVAIHRLRHALTSHEVTVHGRRGFGYWLDENTKNTVRERLAPPSSREVTQQVTSDTSPPAMAPPVPSEIELPSEE